MRRHAKAPSAALTSRHGRSRGLFGLVCLCVLGLAAFLGSGASTAGAVAPGEVPRPLGANPNDRGYELVTPPDTGGNPPSVALTSTDPDRILVGFVAGTGDSTSGTQSAFVGERGEGGWTFRSILPSRDQMPAGNWVAIARSPDFSRFAITTFLGIGQIAPGAILRLTIGAAGSTATLLDPPSLVAVSDAVGSDDMGHVYASILLDRIPDDTNFAPDVYDFGNGEPELISRFNGNGPGGADDPVAPCGVPEAIAGFRTGFLSPTSSTHDQHRTSRDGSRVFFGSPDPEECFSGTANLYLRDRHDLDDPEDDETIRLDPVGTSGENFGSYLLRASETGEQAVFVTPSRLDVASGPADTNSTHDIYRFTLGEGNECLTCVVPEANVSASLNSGFDETIAVSEDLSRVYFLSAEELNGEGVAGATNLYRWRAGQIRYVSPATEIGMHLSSGSQLTPDGSVVIFTSNRPGLNALTGSDNGGFQQYYRYDDNAPAGERLQCISCLANPTANVDSALIWASGSGFTTVGEERGAMSDDGSVIAFKTPDKLIPADINKAEDIYEWSDGELTLLTDGRAANSNKDPIQLWSVSPDGTNILFKSISELIPGATEGPGAMYNARAGGGFPLPAPPGSAAPCSGEDCQAPAVAPPAQRNAASASFAGQGNQRANRKKAAKRKQAARKRACVRKAKKRKASASAKKKAKQRCAKANRRASK